MPTSVTVDQQAASWAQYGLGKVGATPGRLLLVGVLAIILVVVLVGEFTPDSKGLDSEGLDSKDPIPGAPNSPVVAKRTPAAAQKAQNGFGPGKAPSPRPSAPQWPEIPLEEVVQHDIFALPPQLDPPQKQQVVDAPIQPQANESPLQRSRKPNIGLGVGGGNIDSKALASTALVVIGSRERAAVIGSRTVRVGDQIGMLRVVDITRQGIVVARDTP